MEVFSITFRIQVFEVSAAVVYCTIMVSNVTRSRKHVLLSLM